MNFGKLFIALLLLISASLLANDSYGLDVAAYVNKSIVDVPWVYDGLKADGTNGYDFGIGVYGFSKGGVKVKMGLHLWTKNFNPYYKGNIEIDGETHFVRMKEEGNIQYTGVYFVATKDVDEFIPEYNIKGLYLGAGFDVSFISSYKADIMRVDSDNQVLEVIAKDSEVSFLTQEFNTQFDLLVSAGFLLKLSDKVNFCPSAMFTFPMISLFDTGIKVYNPSNDTTKKVRFNVFQAKFGLNLEYKIK